VSFERLNGEFLPFQTVSATVTQTQLTTGSNPSHSHGIRLFEHYQKYRANNYYILLQNRSVKRIVTPVYKEFKKFFKDTDDVLVYFRGHLHSLPELSDRNDVTVNSVNMYDTNVINRWVDIHNDAFNRSWGRKEYQDNIINHDYYDIFEMFELRYHGEIAGMCAIGKYKKNDHIGVGHYIGIKKDFQSLGLGKYLSLYRYHKLRDDYGLEIAEIETKLRHHTSIMLYLKFGFEPKLDADPWNTPRSARGNPVEKAQQKQKQLFNEFLQSTNRY